MSDSKGDDILIEWIRRALQGDAEAQEHLFDRTAPTIQRCVGKTLRPWKKSPWRNSLIAARQEVEDLIQEVFLHLFEKDGKVLKSFDPDIADLEGFVCTIARNRTLMSLRRKSRIDFSMDDGEWPDPPSPDNPERRADFKDLWRHIYLCVSKEFKARDFLLFKWLFIEGRSPQEVAERLRAEVNAIHKWLSRRRKKARKCRELITGLSGAEAGHG